MSRVMGRVARASILSSLAVAAVVAAAPAPVLADDHWWHDDIHRFHEHDIRVWRGGHWWHGLHEGRPGW